MDLYFLLTDYFSIEQISARAIEIFGEEFSEKLFRAQLCYFEGVDYSEEVDCSPLLRQRTMKSD